jgi:hypothetical protein
MAFLKLSAFEVFEYSLTLVSFVAVFVALNFFYEKFKTVKPTENEVLS